MSRRVQRSGSPGGTARKLGTAGQVRSPRPALADAPPATPATHLRAAVLWAQPGPARRSRGLAARHRPALPMGALPARPLRPRLELSPGAALRPRPPGSVCSRLPPPPPAPAPPPRAPPPPIGRCSNRPHPQALQPLSLVGAWPVSAPRAPPPAHWPTGQAPPPAIRPRPLARLLARLAPCRRARASVRGERAAGGQEREVLACGEEQRASDRSRAGAPSERPVLPGCGLFSPASSYPCWSPEGRHSPAIPGGRT